METLRVEQVGFAYASPVLEGVSFELTPGYWGLVGENGAGKSTLLRLIQGELSPESGRILLPRQATVELCPQLVTAVSAAIHELAWDYGKRARRLRGRWRLDPDELARWPTLSPGERKRWQVAAALHRQASVLLLDEPTNHLDAEARQELGVLLAREKVIGLLVSHDRELLQELTCGLLWLANGRVEQFAGSYDEARAARELARKQLTEKKQSLKKEQQRLKQRELSQLHKAQAAEKMRNASRRMNDRNDSDARSILHANRAERAGKKLSAEGSSLKSRRERIESELDQVHVQKELGHQLFAEYTPSPSSTIVSMQLPELRVGGPSAESARVLLSDVSLSLKREDKVWLRGTNGSGKTSLLQALVSAQTSNARSLLLPQTLPSEAQRKLRAELTGLPAKQRGRVLAFVAAQGTEPSRVLDSSAWSPGEAKKVALALGLESGVSALLLDEPTNHLDLPSIEALEALLLQFPGALVLVCHDSRLAQTTTSQIWHLKDGRVVVE